MAQIKIYGLKASLTPIKSQLSDLIHSCVVEALQFPADKRFHRFLNLEAEDFYFPDSRTSRYTIIEVSLMEGRSVAAKKQLIRLLYERLQPLIAPDDLEITLTETPKHNWGIRGQPGDEISLSYKIEI